MDVVRQDSQIDETEKMQKLKVMRTKSIADVLEEVEVVIDTHFFNEFSKTKSSSFLKKVMENQSVIDTRLFAKTWRTINCSPKTMKVIRETQENLLCVGKRKEMITKKRAETKCWCSKTGLPLNAKHIISCCKKVNSEINARHDIIVNILLNNILIKRGLIDHEQKWDDRRMVRTPHLTRSPLGPNTGGPTSGERKAESPEQSSSLTLCGSAVTLEVNGGRWWLM